MHTFFISELYYCTLDYKNIEGESIITPGKKTTHISCYLFIYSKISNILSC